MSRKEAYLADITYGTNHEIAFDYLRDNIRQDSNFTQRGFNFAIIDEVDSILIDEARTPLIISGPDVRAKAEMFAKVFWIRLESELIKSGFSSTVQFKNTEYVGDDSTHKGMLKKHDAIEILLKLTVRDNNKDKLNVFRKLLPSMILSGPAGVAVTGGAPIISDVVSYWPALMPQEYSLPNIRVYEQKKGEENFKTIYEKLQLQWPITKGTAEIDHPPIDPWSPSLISTMSTSRPIRVCLMEIAHARSGDKGDTVNIGLIGRSPE